MNPIYHHSRELALFSLSLEKNSECDSLSTGFLPDFARNSAHIFYSKYLEKLVSSKLLVGNGALATSETTTDTAALRQSIHITDVHH